MSHDASNEPDPCVEPDPTMSASQWQEIRLLNELFALIDPRPDPGVYRNADSEGAARDLVELNILISFADPRPFTDPWVFYIGAEDLIDQR